MSLSTIINIVLFVLVFYFVCSLVPLFHEFDILYVLTLLSLLSSFQSLYHTSCFILRSLFHNFFFFVCSLFLVMLFYCCRCIYHVCLYSMNHITWMCYIFVLQQLAFILCFNLSFPLGHISKHISFVTIFHNYNASRYLF